MKSYVLKTSGAQAPLSLEERAAQALGPRDIRVRVRAASLNYRDLLIARRAAAGELAAPVVPLSDGCGEVIEVGAETRRFAVGDRVAANFFPDWVDGPLSDAHHAGALGGGADGMLREEVVLHENAWVRIPAHLSYEEGATLPCAAVTAWHALFEAARLRAGETVLVQGTGGVALFALQLARAAGARVLLTSGGDGKRERALALGAEHVIDYRADAEWGATARRLAGGDGVDVALEIGGPATFDQSVAALRYGGRMGLIGVLTGFAGSVNTYAVFHKTVRVDGIYVGSRRMFEALNRALSASRIHPVIDRVFDWQDAQQAYDHLAGASHFGKVVIRVG
jgi:NADPH:quinone reductase-like Zn-dependent oxidoreductase